MTHHTPETLKAIRKALGFTQAEFATRLGYTQVHIAYLERGTKPITKKLSVLLDAIAPETPAPKRLTGAEVRAYREKLGLTQAEMAERLDVGYGALCGAERRDRAGREVSKRIDAAAKRLMEEAR